MSTPPSPDTQPLNDNLEHQGLIEGMADQHETHATTRNTKKLNNSRTTSRPSRTRITPNHTTTRTNKPPFTEPPERKPPHAGNILNNPLTHQVSSSRPLLSTYYLATQTDASTHRPSDHGSSSMSNSPILPTAGQVISPCTTTRRSPLHRNSHQTRSPHHHHTDKRGWVASPLDPAIR